ncbi:YitT family protein [Weissella diestrammenae]|uniref:YitT family protein n=1 Tax=Weissella diestrammenae TaxID=1162633 RepID=A0A7G9T4Z2_9LACO|nr:YitT family protein [Weissella diestrammenae]MCM0582889.1 YitT family protein [Weissella diestrammenae]QNN75167.1 YitT family protein [Weissella diestrammenae]
MNFTRIKNYAVLIGGFILGAFLIAIAMNFFFIPNKIFSAGFNGIAQLLSLFFGVFHINVEVGTMILLFNIPIALVGWFWAGRRFVIISFLNNLLASVIQIVLPKVSVVNHEPILAALFGGVLVGVSMGITFKLGFSTGGMDVVAAIVQKRTGKSIGFVSMFINGVIVIIAGFFIGWQNAMYTIIGIYATSLAVDSIYTKHQKLTALIVTKKPDQVIENLQANVVRGITILDSVGAYTKRPSKTLMMVLSRYELNDTQRLAKEADPDAFINILNTINVSNNFVNEDLQHQIRMEKLAAQSHLSDNLHN